MSAQHPVIGVDLGATNIQAAVVDGDRRIVGRAHRTTEAARGEAHVLERIAECVDGACAEASIDRAAIQTVGIAAAGAIDIPRGVVLDAPNLGWVNVALRDRAAERLGCRVMVDNDVNGAIWGEHRAGAGRGRGDMLGVWVGTGIGGGLVLGGTLRHGAFFTAGELGQTIIEPDAPAGARTLEECASRSGMQRILGERLGEEDSVLAGKAGGEAIDTAAIAGAFAKGDPLTVRVVERSARLVGIAAANVVTLLALDTVIIGGGMTEVLGEPYLRRVRESFDDAVFPERCRACALLMTELRGDAALIGAAMLARC